MRTMQWPSAAAVGAAQSVLPIRHNKGRKCGSLKKNSSTMICSLQNQVFCAHGGSTSTSTSRSPTMREYPTFTGKAIVISRLFKCQHECEPADHRQDLCDRIAAQSLDDIVDGRHRAMELCANGIAPGGGSTPNRRCLICQASAVWGWRMIVATRITRWASQRAIV